MLYAFYFSLSTAQEGMRFAFREGGRTVGAGVVAKIGAERGRA